MYASDFRGIHLIPDGDVSTAGYKRLVGIKAWVFENGIWGYRDLTCDEVKQLFGGKGGLNDVIN